MYGFMGPLLTYLSTAVPSILTLRYYLIGEVVLTKQNLLLFVASLWYHGSLKIVAFSQVQGPTKFCHQSQRSISSLTTNPSSLKRLGNQVQVKHNHSLSTIVTVKINKGQITTTQKIERIAPLGYTEIIWAFKTPDWFMRSLQWLNTIPIYLGNINPQYIANNQGQLVIAIKFWIGLALLSIQSMVRQGD